jgi:hypothetical protein
MAKMTATQTLILKILDKKMEDEWVHINYVIVLLGYPKPNPSHLTEWSDSPGADITYQQLDDLKTKRLVRCKKGFFEDDTFWWQLTTKGRARASKA